MLGGLRKYIDCNYRAVKANSGLVSSACTAMAFHSDYKDNRAVSLMVGKFFARDQPKSIEEKSNRMILQKYFSQPPSIDI